MKIEDVDKARNLQIRITNAQKDLETLREAKTINVYWGKNENTQYQRYLSVASGTLYDTFRVLLIANLESDLARLMEELEAL